MKYRKNLLFLFLLLLYTTTINSHNLLGKYKCGSDKSENIPKPAKNIIKVEKKEPLFLRHLDELDEDGFKNLTIYLDLINLEEEMEENDFEEEYKFIIINSMEKAKNVLETLIKVKYINSDYNFKDEEIRDLKINNWDKEKFGTEPYNKNISMKSLGIDLIIFSKLSADNEFEDEILAQASPKLYDKNTAQPLVGAITINKDISFEKEKSQEFFDSILVHEFIHILGFTNFYLNYFNYIFTKENVYRIKKSYVNSTKVVKIAKKYFNCSTVDGVELESMNEFNSSHWESRILLGDIMTTMAYTEEQVISEFTLSLLEDLGYYKVKYYTGGLMRYGKHKGCEFLENKCVNEGKINPLFENEFFNLEDIEPSCSSGRQSRTYNLIFYHSNLSEQFQYYSNKNWGGWENADYCPIAKEGDPSMTDKYYLGHCAKGTGDYGSRIRYDNTSYFIHTSQAIKDRTGETYSNHSYCILSSLVKEKSNNVELISKTLRGVCYEMFCSAKSLTIKIHTNYILCPRSGGKITVEGYKGFFLCPDYNLVCSGTVLCNDLFDCIEKKSEIKENSYEYDYEIKTSQNIERAEEEDFDSENNYELSEDGVCPQFCKKCLKNQQCSKCKSEYALVGFKETKKRLCKLEKELKIGFYQDINSIYYQCMEHCQNCKDDSTCDKCHDDYIYLNSFCKLKIDNCSEYNLNGTCKNCDKGFAFKEEERNICKNISEFDEYYTKDDGISYFPCNGEEEDQIKNCKKCIYNKNNNKLECNECQTNYFILDEEKEKCNLKSDKNDYYYINETHGKTCSKAIENCQECENENKCFKCQENFFLINNITDKCYNKNEIIPIDEYFLGENNLTYYSCSNSKYHLISNCRKCSSKYNCSSCQIGFTFINGNRDKCVKITELEDKYYPDPDDENNYKRCSEINQECIKCSSSKICTFCNEGYGVYKEENKCINISTNQYYKNKTDNLYYLCNETIYGCLECKNENICLVCDEIVYTLINNICRNISELGDYYFKKENTSRYKLCKEGVAHCERCKSENECIKCFENYTKINNKNDSCNKTRDLDGKYYPDPNDDNNYISCLEVDPNCITCESSNKCTSCFEDFGVFKEENKCVNISDNDYYKNVTDNLYYLCNETIEGCLKCKNETICLKCEESNYILIDNICFNKSYLEISCRKKIENCEICKSENECLKCIDNYTQINNTNTSCYNINDLGEEYYPNPIDDNYIKCSDTIKNCKNCNSTQCFLCEDGYIFINDDFNKCHNKSSINLSNYFTNNNISYYSCDEEKYKYLPECLLSKTIPIIKTSTISTIIIKNPITNKTIISTDVITSSFINSTELTNSQTTINTNINKTIISSSIINLASTIYTSNIQTTHLLESDILTETSDTIIRPPRYPIPYPFPSGINSIFFLQAQYFNGKLLIFIVADFMIQDFYFFNIIIKIYYSENLRNLYEEENNITIGLNSNYISNSENEVICLASEDLKKELGLDKIDGVKIYNIIPLNNNTKSTFNINLNSYKEYLDTKYTQESIKNGNIDFNKIAGKRSDYKVNLYKLELKSNPNCSVNFETKKRIEDNYEFKINFININNSSEIYWIDCSSNNQGKIFCPFNKNIKSDYLMEDYIYYNNNSLTVIYLPNKKTIIPLNCNLEYFKIPNPTDPKKNKLILIIIIAVASALLTIIISITIRCCIRKRRKNLEKYNNNNDFNDTAQKNIYSGSSSNSISNQ